MNIPSAVSVSGSVCARVGVGLTQEVTLAQHEFRAALELQNAPQNVPLQNVRVTLDIRNKDGFPSTDLFRLKVSDLAGVQDVNGSGVVMPGVIARVVWSLTPLHEAAPSESTRYEVGGELQYTQGDSVVAVPLFPTPITVKPNPRLIMHYFLQHDVAGDDPFTPELELSEPFTLGLLVINAGYAVARAMRVSSFQPRIVDNDKGLLVDFRVVGTQVGVEQVRPSLEVSVGDIDPQQTAVVRWLLSSSLQGRFTNLAANFEHLDDTGGRRASLIERVEFHELSRVVHAEPAENRGAPDFLINSLPRIQDVPDLLYRSDGTIEPVTALLDAMVDGLVSDTHLHIRVDVLSPPADWVYLRLDEPAQDNHRLLQVVRSDGREVPLGDNAWTTRRTIRKPGGEPVRERRLHLFDKDSTGSYTLIYGYTTPTITSLDPPVLVAGGAAFTLTVNGTGFVGDSTVQWNGADRATTYVSPTRLRAEILDSDLTAPGSAQVAVGNPAQSGGASRPATLVINAAPETDTIPPMSAVLPLFEQTSDPSFTVFWSGADEANGSGLKDFDIFVAQDDGPYTPWLSGVTQTSATYTGNYGRTYRFYSIARDNAGNVEPTPDAPDATTRVSPEPRNPMPAVRSLDPPSVAAGGPEFLLTVSGADFAPGAIVQWNEQPRLTTFASNTQLTAAITAADIAAAGPTSVTVLNPAPGGGISEPLSFSVRPAIGTPHIDPMNIDHIVDKAYEDSSLEELLDAPVSALQGLSEGDAERLREAFHIRTVRDLATNKFFLRAQGIHALAQSKNAQSKKKWTNQELTDELRRAADGLLMISETDHPLTVVRIDAPEITPDLLRQLASAGADAPVASESADEFFAGAMAEPEEWETDEDPATARRFRALVDMLTSNLTGVRAYRVGEIEIYVYIIGRSHTGAWLGVATRVVET